MAFSSNTGAEKYRSYLNEEDVKNIQWRFDSPPDYEVVNKLFEEGRKALSLEEKKELGGGYNSLLQTSLPQQLRCYNPDEESADSSHRAFTTAFPRGFALEVLQVYSGPPVIVYKFRHWGFMEGPFKGHAPTGEMIELFGMAIFELDECSKIVKVEFFYDRGELLGGLLKGGYTATDIPSSCPFLKNTG